MTLYSLRRVISLVGALSVSALSFVALGAPAAAASGAGTLFGLGPTSILTIDPASGAGTTFVNLPTVDTFPGASYSNLALDASGHRLFTQREVFTQQPDGSLATTFQIVTVDTADATVAPVVSPDMPTGVTQLVYDSGTQTLFGQTNMCCPFELVRIDPTTGAQTNVAAIPGVQPLGMTVAPSLHALYFATEDFVAGQFQPVITLVTVDTQSGSLTQSPELTKGIVFLAYDSGSGKLFGKTFCCPANLVQVNPSTGAETAVGPGGLNLGEGFAADPVSHNIYMTDDQLGISGFQQFVDSVNDQSGAVSVSSGALPSNTFVSSLAFFSPTITPADLLAATQNAISSGAINNQGVGTSLLSKLSQAQAARDRGQCGTAAKIYQAFVNEVNAQSGKTIASATASQLVSEAQFLIGNCP